DETSMVYHDLPGGYANALTGLDLLDTDYEGLAFDGGNGYYCRELCAVKDAQILAKFEDGTCAVSQRKHGAGKFSVFNTFAFYGYAKGNDGCAAWTEKLLGVLPVCDNCELKVKFASNAEGTVAVVFNYTDRMQNGTMSFGGKHWTLDVPAHEVLILT
ncbi:MAG: hypothetical protein IIV87_03935, partial [Oscillospiraceae bacterium]|nr:hypothetical protein [Oscillospiraceae bacterium]